MKTTKRQSSGSTFSLYTIILLCIPGVIIFISAYVITNFQTRNRDTEASGERVFSNSGRSVKVLEQNLLELNQNPLQEEMQQVQ